MSRRKKVATDKVSVSLDFGGSGLKGIYQTGESTSAVLFMEPEVISASLDSLNQKTNGNLGNSYPENLAWVGVGDDYRAVGYLAASRYYGNAGLSKKKYTLAVYRTLAALWVVQQKLKLPSCFDLSMGALLPPGEFEDSQALLENLKEAFVSFETPTGKMTVNLKDFYCYPEGAGVYLMYSQSLGEAMKRMVNAVAMVGYRNASVLVSHRGIVSSGRTIDLGMVRLVEMVQARTSGLKTEVLVKAIAASGESPQLKHFLGLTETGISAVARRNEASKIVSALIAAKKEYVTALTNLLEEVLPMEELDEVVFCGGTADYLRNELDSLFPATPVKWHGGFQAPSFGQEQWLGNRLADVYGLNEALGAKLARSPQGEVVHG